MPFRRGLNCRRYPRHARQREGPARGIKDNADGGLPRGKSRCGKGVGDSAGRSKLGQKGPGRFITQPRFVGSVSGRGGPRPNRNGRNGDGSPSLSSKGNSRGRLSARSPFPQQRCSARASSPSLRNAAVMIGTAGSPLRQVRTPGWPKSLPQFDPAPPALRPEVPRKRGKVHQVDNAVAVQIARRRVRRRTALRRHLHVRAKAHRE